MKEAEMARAIQSLMFLTTEIAWRLTGVMVAKEVITKGEARSTLYALAEGIRRDAHGTPSEEMSNMLGRTLESTADQIWGPIYVCDPNQFKDRQLAARCF